MSVLFCVPAIGREDVLDMKIAGLTLWQRLYQLAKRAGMIPCFIVAKDSQIARSLPREAVANEMSDLRCSFERAVFCRPGLLPDLACLRFLKDQELPEGRFLDLGGLVVFEPSAGCKEFDAAFSVEGFDRLTALLSSHLEPLEAGCEGDVLPVEDDKDVARAERRLFKALVKDTEGFMSRHVERPISLFISKRIVDTSITPNQITIISTIIGLAGAFLISVGQGFWQIAGSLLFLVHSIVDGCDGEIARIKFMESRLGGVLDFWGDNLVHAAVFTAIGVEWSARTGSSLPLYLSAAAVAGTFLSASIVYFSTMRNKKGDQGPLYTSVNDGPGSSRVTEIADFLSRRDFIYLVVILAFFNRLDWFLVAAAAGSLIFAGVLLWIRFRG